jgi:hypothetical protein
MNETKFNCPCCQTKLIITSAGQVKRETTPDWSADCAYCGNTFPVNKSSRRFCCEDCQIKWNNRNRAIKRRQRANSQPLEQPIILPVIDTSELQPCTCGSTDIIRVDNKDEHYRYCSTCYMPAQACQTAKDADFLWNNPDQLLEVQTKLVPNWKYPHASERQRLAFAAMADLIQPSMQPSR